MKRLAATFERLARERRKALIPFITAGDPSLEATVPVMHALVEAGADVLELGVPFSDPMADGAVIQLSSERALARGAGLSWVLETVRAFRERDADTPVVLMGYLNPVEIRGSEAFAHAAAQAGVDGVLLVDLPPEEAGDYRAAFSKHAIALILLASPTTPEARLERLCEDAQGYLYYVNFAGVTGASAQLNAGAAAARLDVIRRQSKVPVVAGFGIHDAQSAAAMAALADGVVVGSALVRQMAEHTAPAAAARVAGAFLASLRTALDAGGPPPVR